jgi:hypothetical protein
MLDFTTAASRNVVAITPQMNCLPVMILFHVCSMIKDERYKKSFIFVIFSLILVILQRESLHELNPFCDAAIAKSIVM